MILKKHDIPIDGETIGFLQSLFGKKPAGRKGSYGTLVAWVEKRYGKIEPTMSETEVRMKFDQAIQDCKSTKGEKAVLGLKKYVENGHYKSLINQENK
jgi:hypothetical protein